MRKIFLTLAIAITVNSYAQQTGSPSIKSPPIGVEGLFGNRGMSYQMIANKRLQSLPRVGYFAITNFVKEWDSRHVNDYMIQGNVSYEFVKGFDITAGFHLTQATGIRPAIGVMYSFSDPEWVVVITPRMYVDDFANIEGFALAEYKPKISEQWRFYSRAQTNYNATMKDGSHGRSYLWLRAGVSYKEFSFGAGANLDAYGPARVIKNNFGGFIRIQVS